MSEAKKTTLATADYRVTFDAGVNGVDPIRPAHEGGTEVPAGKAKEVEAAAKKSGIELRKL